MDTVCVFGGSELGKDERFRLEAYDLGKALATRKIALVYGGGIRGLKGCVAGTAATRGCKVLGVTLKNNSNFTLGSELKVTSLHERLGFMLQNADAFIALPGGLGTLEELFTILFWGNREFHKKPIGLLNVNGFYSGLLSFLDTTAEQGFVPQARRITLVSASTADQLLDMLQESSPKLLKVMKEEDPPGEGGSRKRKLDTTLHL